MLRYIVDKVKKDYKKLEKIIMDSKDKNDLVNKKRRIKNCCKYKSRCKYR